MLSISSKVLHHNLGLPSRHMVRWIGAAPYEYYRDADGWHVQPPDSDKALVFPSACELGKFFEGETPVVDDTISGYLERKQEQDARPWYLGGTD